MTSSAATGSPTGGTTDSVTSCGCCAIAVGWRQRSPNAATAFRATTATAVTAAACFHDAVYDPRADDNEERSAELAEAQLASLGWEPARRRAVAELIRATAGHLVDPPGGAAGSPWERPILLDADLAVLGSEPAAYDAYVNGVRSEYAHLSASEWIEGRSMVVGRLLARSPLYATYPARAWWEERARANLAAELATLSR